MQQLLQLTERYAPLAAFAALLVIAVIVANHLGARLSRHDQRFRILELRIENLHKDRRAAYARSLQIPITVTRGSIEPPPLSQARTIERDDPQTRDTVPYPPDTPPRGGPD